MSAKNSSSRDTASRFRQVIICILAAMLSLAGALPVLADAPPGLPSSFWGTATLNGGNAPDGTIVSAWINGVKCTETATFTNIGQSVYTIDVPADDPDTSGVQGGVEGNTIVFQIGTLNADQTAIWHEGTNTGFNLTAQNHAPAVGGVNPSIGSCNVSDTISFTTTYSDSDGWQDIVWGLFLINQGLDGRNAAYVYYKSSTNQVYLMADDNAAWSHFMGGYAPGSANTIENSQVIVDLSQTSVSHTDTTLSITWAFRFKSALSGKSLHQYLYTRDSSGATDGWTEVGTWSVNNPSNRTPSVGTATPSSGSCPVGETQLFTTNYSDPDGWQDIVWGLFLINQGLDGRNAAYVYYKSSTNQVYLMADDNAAWSHFMGGYAPGSANTIENSQVIVDLSQTSVSHTDTTLSITWAFRFKSALSGKSLHQYLYTRDSSGATDGWTEVGTWSVSTIGVQIEPMKQFSTGANNLVLPILPGDTGHSVPHEVMSPVLPRSIEPMENSPAQVTKTVPPSLPWDGEHSDPIPQKTVSPVLPKRQERLHPSGDSLTPDLLETENAQEQEQE